MNILNKVVLVVSLLSSFLAHSQTKLTDFNTYFGDVNQSCEALVEQNHSVAIAPYLQHEQADIRQAAAYKQALVHSCNYELNAAVELFDTLDVSILADYFDKPALFFEFRIASNILSNELASTNNFTVACEKMTQVYHNSRAEKYSDIYFNSDLLTVLYCDERQQGFAHTVRNLTRIKQSVEQFGSTKVKMHVLNEIGVFYARHDLPELSVEQFCRAADIAFQSKDDQRIHYQYNCALELIRLEQFAQVEHYLSLIKDAPKDNPARQQLSYRTWNYVTIKSLFAQQEYAKLLDFTQHNPFEFNDVASENRFYWTAKLESCMQIGDKDCAASAFNAHPYIKHQTPFEAMRDTLSLKTLAKYLSSQAQYQTANDYYARESELLNQSQAQANNAVNINGFAKLNSDLLKLKYENIKANLAISYYGIGVLIILLLVAAVTIVCIWLLKRRFKTLSETDSLTHTYNHIASLNAIQDAMHAKTFQSIAIGILDIDHFKDINDQFGHPFGDKVIRNTVSIIKQEIHSTDIIGRLGGEEFIIALHNTTQIEAGRVFESIRNNIEQSQVTLGEATTSVTVSIGFSYITEQMTAIEEAYKHIDRRLYEAKTQGRNRVLET